MKKTMLYLSTVDENAQVLAQKYGLGLEICEFSTAWNMDREFSKYSKIVEEKVKCAQRFVLHGPYSELFPCAIDPKARDLAAMRYRQTIQTADRYGIHRIVLHGGFNPWLYFPCWYQEQSVIFWKEFIQEVPENVTILLENVLEKQPEHLGEIVRQVGDPRLRMCLDVGHAHAYSEADAGRWLRSCADVIDHFHVHNNDGSWDTHSPLFEGTIPMEQLLEEMKNTCPHATITLELTEGESSVQWLQDRKILEE